MIVGRAIITFFDLIEEFSVGFYRITPKKVKVNSADTRPNFAKAVSMQPEQKKHAQATTSQLREGIKKDILLL